ncbi:ActS/PrrB/RegB family redox-sensitive histidine kinase [Agrobacterium sp. SHOUNA12C]|uniref:histidine kinase n=1 Tax=Rhizobium rhizogenes NBRC 13257 TaxID=1220581 RepID=A0AA87QCD0_RHIRH|nr:MULTISPECIES: ActS/PrrB/RegB family redox-sensitive histidine kinase [Rhizobium]KAA6482739.1 sensor histidine kinase [Agrobacterium sp. ICMP 7243]MCJ9724160.1 ActS/PrrB/RegB family redox-sensitive histidine kinase [Agrobacterium sp. BETTINA12B]MCJ9759884.1 ActS/PrrB/RegB family redox-sensitive histidine kinase [Agrobacterium sp. SHOUNA12C]OCI91558.1 two-component sensor histidine kinase [Agrobacterium sp. 13-626]OCJ23886.1 two-component sensor histidine kinase [Agrobacterium sp. B131/95]OC
MASFFRGLDKIAIADAKLQDDYHTSRRLRLQTLVRLRWLAVGGQTATVMIVAFWLKFPMPLLACCVLIACLAWINFFLTLRYPPTHRLEPPAAFALLGLDLLQLCGLLLITGGLANPFSALVCVPVIISFASQPIRYSMVLIVLAMICITGLAFSPFPLPWYGGVEVNVHSVMQLGVWCSIASTMAFAAFYAYRVSMEASQLADALAATELVLQREKHLSQLDGLAAAAAHELGTPLATISVVAKEMERELKEDDRFREDVALLRSQSERCRDILRRLTTLSAEDEAHMRRLTLSSMMEEVIAPHREFGIKLELIEKSPRAGEPVLNRNAGIMYGLGNLIENAVDYARKTVTVTVEYDPALLIIIIEDDGNGYAPDILTRIGEPYVTTRQRDDTAGGLGLGLFIAKTLLERSGAAISFGNRDPETPGARIRVEWPRVLIDSNSTK